MRARVLSQIKGISLAGLIGIGSALAVCRYIDANCLKPEDFEKARWIEVYNPTGRIWNPYMSEDIQHNQHNWDLYVNEVSKANKGLQGYIKLPDLDRDGSVNN